MCKYDRVGVVGHYWTDNFGDLLLRDLMVDFLLNHCGVTEVNKINKVDYQGAKSKLGKVFYILSFAFRCDFIVFGGGGYFESKSLGYKNTGSLFVFLLLAISLRLLFKKYCIAGVGVGPDVSGVGGWLIRAICLLSSDTSVRDEESETLLRSLGVKGKVDVFSDAALVVSGKYKVTPVAKSKVAIHLLLRGEEYERLVGELEALINSIPSNIELYLVSDNGPIGSEQGLLKNCNRSVTIVECNGADEFIQFLGSCDFVVTTKLHVGIVSYALGVGVYNFYRHPKCLRFYKQIGWLDNCVSMMEFDDKHVLNILDAIKKFDSSSSYNLIKREAILEMSESVYLNVQRMIGE